MSANGGGANNNVTVIDGATNSAIFVPTWCRFEWHPPINPVTNKIYVANRQVGEVAVIDGANNSATNIAVGGGPYGVAVNPITNRIYVTNSNGNTLIVIDGADNSTTTIGVGVFPAAVDG